MVHMDVCDNHIADVLERYAPTAGYVHVSTTTVNSLLAMDNVFVLEFDHRI